MYVFPRSILVLQLSWCNLLPAALRFVFLKEDSGLFPHCLSAPPSFSAFLLLSCPQASAWVWSMGGNARRWKVKGERRWVVSPHHTHILPALLWASVLSLPDCSSSWEGWSSTLQLPQPQPLTPSDSISSLCHPDLPSCSCLSAAAISGPSTPLNSAHSSSPFTKTSINMWLDSLSR